MPFVGTLLVFLIQLTGFLSRPALFIQIRDLNIPGVLILADRNPIADFNIFTGFAALTVDVNLTAANGFGSQAARLKKPRSPQPFIDSDFRNLSQAATHSRPRL